MSLKHLLNDDDIDLYRTHVPPQNWDNYDFEGCVGMCIGEVHTNINRTEPSSTQSWDQYFGENFTPIAFTDPYESILEVDLETSHYTQELVDQWTADTAIQDGSPQGDDPMVTAKHICYGTVSAPVTCLRSGPRQSAILSCSTLIIIDLSSFCQTYW